MSENEVNGEEKVDEVVEKDDSPDNVTPMNQADAGQIPQAAMLNINDLQNIRAFMDRVELKGASEAKILAMVCTKIETILQAEAAAKKAADDQAKAEGK